MNSATVRAALYHVRRLVGAPDSGLVGDGELLRRFAAGHDADAFHELLRRHGAMVFGAARRLLRHPQDAEDVFQGTFLTLARKAPTLRKPGSVAAWLHGVACCLALRARTAAARRRLHEGRAGRRPDPEPSADGGLREALTVLDEELSRLSGPLQAPLVLCYLEGATRDEAARRLGWSLATLKRRLERGRDLLRRRLERRGVTLSVALLTAAVAGQTASAGLLATTAHAAASFAAGRGAAGASAEAVALAEGMARGVLGAKGKALVALVLAAGLVCGYGLSAGGGRESVQPAEPPVADCAPPEADPQGEPLPDGAVVRMGSTRFRHAGLRHFVCVDQGKSVITAGSDRAIRTWDLATGRLTRAVQLQGDGPTGWALVLSGDGKHFAGAHNGQLIVWDVETGKPWKKVPEHAKEELAGLDFTPDGKTLVAMTWRPRLVLWDLEKETSRQIEMPLRKIGHDSTFHFSVSPDGKWIVAGGGSGEALCVYELATGRQVHAFRCNATTSIVSPDSKRLAVVTMTTDKGASETVVRLYDLATGRETAQFPQEMQESFFSLAFSPDGKMLACGFSDKSRVLDVATGKVVYHLTRRPIVVDFTPDGKTLLASTGTRLRLWDAATGAERQEDPADFGHLPVLAVSPDNRLLASADWMEQSVGLWDASSGRLIRQMPLKGDGRYVRSLAFSADGRTLGAGQMIGLLQFWDVPSGKEQRTVQLNDPAARGSAYFYQFYPVYHSKQVVTLDRVFAPGDSTRLAVWDINTGKLLKQQTLSGAVRSAAWLAGGVTAVLPLDAGLTAVDVNTGTVRYQVTKVASTGPVVASPDGRLLARPPKGEIGEITVWEAATGKRVASWAGRADHLALAANGRSLVTTDHQHLRVWDLATGKERRHWALPMSGVDSWGNTCVYALVLSHDGRRAFTSLADGTALVWDLAPALRGVEPLVKAADEKAVAGWWENLSSTDAAKAYAAVWRLTEAPELAVPFLGRQLKPAGDEGADAVRRLIEELDSDQFATREKAYKGLEARGDAAVPAMRQALGANPSAEVRRRLEKLLARSTLAPASPELLRRLRAIQVLERVGSPEARRVLESLAAGPAHASETQEAKAALARLRAAGQLQN